LYIKDDFTLRIIMAIDLGPTAKLAAFQNTLIGTYGAAITSPYQSPLINTTANMGGIYIMSGTMPADISTVTSYSAISSNILIAYPNSTLSVVYDNTSATSIQASLSAAYTAASASGTATWFIGLSRGATSGGVPNDTIMQSFMGTVGAIGSGADLTLPSVNIVSGTSYKLVGPVLVLPTSW
jgi:hypothetical protein